jgi:hypothetical protein
MKEYLEIGPTPSAEPCFGVGHPLERAEARIYRDQLQREFPTADLRVKGFPHEFGTYHEVCAYYFDDDEQSVETAFAVESDANEHWDSIARKELRILKQQYEQPI